MDAENSRAKRDESGQDHSPSCDPVDVYKRQAFAIALELPLVEMKDMLMKAGFALSHSNKFDIIVEYFVEQDVYKRQALRRAAKAQS